MRRSPRPTAARRRSSGWRSTPARSRPASTGPTSGCRPRRSRSLRDYVVSIKGPLTTPVGGGIRSLNVALAPGARPLRLPAPDPVLQGRAVAGQGAREDQHGDLPRELGGHLRRHRVRGREREGQAPDQGPAGRLRRQEDPLPGDLRDRHQAGLARGHRAAGAQGHPVRDRPRQALGDAGPQGQHHEVHRGRLPRLGLRPGPARVQGGRDRRRPVVQVQEPEERQGHRRQGRHRRRVPAADPAAPGRVFGDRDA